MKLILASNLVTGTRWRTAVRIVRYPNVLSGHNQMAATRCGRVRWDWAHGYDRAWPYRLPNTMRAKPEQVTPERTKGLSRSDPFVDFQHAAGRQSNIVLLADCPMRPQPAVGGIVAIENHLLQ